MLKRRLFAATLLAALGVPPVAGAPAVLVPTVTLQRSATPGTLALDGALAPVKQSTIAAQVGGNVIGLFVKAGDPVKPGQVVARLDPRELQAGVARADAAHAQAQASLTAAQQNAERTRELRTQNFVSQAALDLAVTQLAAARAEVEQAAAARRQAVLVGGYAEVAAPFAGVVLATHVEVGDLAVPGRPLITLYEPGMLRAVVQVPASRAVLAAGARDVSIELADGRTLKPEQRQVLPSTDAVSQTVEWRLVLSRADSAALRPGQSVRVQFRAAAAQPTGAPRTALSVPASAVLRRGELTAVYVLDQGRFVLRQVRSGATFGDRVEILAGADEGQVIALDAVRAGLAGARPAAAADPR